MPTKRRFKNRETRVKLMGGEIRFNLEGKGMEAWQERLNNFKTNASDMQPFFQAWGNYFLGSIQRNFASEGRPNRWQPLAEATVKQRIRQGYPGRRPILQRSGTLKRGFRLHTDKTFMRITNNVPYFKYHQQDDGNGRIMPRRVMVYMQDADKAQLTRMFNQHLRGEL